MKTKTLITIAIFIASIQAGRAQQTNEICEAEKVITLTHDSKSIGGVVFVDDTKTYVFEPGLTAIFQPEWEYANHGRLVAFKSDVDCIVYSKENSETGWSMIIPKEELTNFKSGSPADDIIVLRSIRFTDDRNGWATAKITTNGIETGVILHTDDGGQKWMIQFIGGSVMKLNTSCFQDAQEGTISGNRSIGSNLFDIVLHTKDGGNTWEEYSSKSLYSKY